MRDPNAQIWWVDGRRLEPAVDGGADEGTPRHLIAIAALGVGLLLAGGGALVVTRSDDGVSTVQGSATSTSPFVATTAAPVTTATTEPPATTVPASTTTTPEISAVPIRLGETFEPVRGIAPPRVSGLAIGPTGVWAMRPETGLLYRVDPTTNEVALSVEVSDAGTNGTRPVLGVGFGSVWVIEQAQHHVVRVSEDSGDVTGRIEIGQGAEDLAVTPEAVWVVFEGSSGVEIARIEPATDELTHRRLLTDDPAHSAWIVSAHEALWVGYAWSSHGWVMRVEPTTGEVTATAEVSCLAGLASHRGAILGIDSCPGGGGRQLVEIDPDSGAVAQEHRLMTSAGPIATDGDLLAMATTVQDAETVAWWPGALDETPGSKTFTELVEPVTGLAVDGTSVWLATSGSALLVRIDGLWDAT